MVGGSCGLCLPVHFIAQHGIEDDQELAHASDHDDLELFAAKPLGEGGDHRIACPCRETCHIQHLPHCRPSTLDMAVTAALAAVIVEGSDTGQAGHGTSRQAAELG